MGLYNTASSEVAVYVTLLEPRVVIASKAGRSCPTGFLTGLQGLILSEQLRTAGYVKSFLD